MAEEAQDEVLVDEPMAEEKDEAMAEDKDEAMAEEKDAEELKEEEKAEPKEEADGEAKEEMMEEDAADVAEEPAPEEPRGEQEDDAPEDTRKKVDAAAIALDMSTATPNAMATGGGRMLMSLCDGGLQFLHAGVRGNVGLKAGRYMFEVKILETLNLEEIRGRDRNMKLPMPKQLVRVGFTSSPKGWAIIDDGPDNVSFDSEANYVHMRQRTRFGHRINKESVMGVLLNLDESSPNKNTISLFTNGVRLSKPVPLPESLVGKTLYPIISYKNVTLQVNFGPTPLTPLSFTCRMIGDAAVADVELLAAPKKGKREVIFPVGLPDQGVFDFLDTWLEKNPHHIEFSDRKILDWARRSYVFRPRGYVYKESNDKPGMKFEIPTMDDHSIQKALFALAPVCGRDLVHMELRENLLKEARATNLKRFPASDFKRIALVAVGEPPAEFKAKVQELILADKRRRAEQVKKGKGEKGAKGGARGYPPPPPKAPRRDAQEADAEDGEKKDETAEAVEDVEAIELTEEEKQLWYRKQSSDLPSKDLAKFFASFSLPAEAEGFDEVRYVWQGKDKAASIVKDWITTHKKTQRCEGLEPSEWFKERREAWKKQVQEWRTKQGDKKKKQDAEKNDDLEDDLDDRGDEDEGEEAEVDVFEVKDVNDVGNGKPLYEHFEYEDWTLLSLRYDLHLLVHAFRRDLADPDRLSFPESHLSFYFQKYYERTIRIDWYGCKEWAGLVELIKECVNIDPESKLLVAPLPDDTPLDKFLRLTEEHRRERQRCVDAGDESAKLQFTRPNRQIGGKPPPPSKGGGKGKGGAPKGRDVYGGGRFGAAPPPPPRGEYGGGVYGGTYGGKGGGGAAPVGQKRSYPPPPVGGHAPSKYPRHSGYGGSGGGGDRAGGPSTSSRHGSRDIPRDIPRASHHGRR